MSFNDFFNQYNGQKNVGNTPQNIGQCVGLIEVYIRGLGLDQVWGNADDLYANAPDASFVKIPNTPTGIPQQGDVIVWSSEFNGGVGHTGIATGKGDLNTFDCFEQNDPIGSNCHVKNYNYSYVTGWLRPKVSLEPTIQIPSATFETLVTKSSAYDKFTAAGFNSIDDVNKKVSDLQNKLSDCQNSTQPPTVPPTPPIVTNPPTVPPVSTTDPTVPNTPQPTTIPPVESNLPTSDTPKPPSTTPSIPSIKDSVLFRVWKWLITELEKLIKH